MHPYQKLEHHDKNLKDILNVNWCLTNICNFKCTYCPANLHDGTQPGIKYDVCISSINKIREHYKDKKIFFEFTGGEVTYYKNFIEVAKHVKSLDCDLGIISNGKRELSFWEKIRESLDHICLSYHGENDYGDHFVEVANYLNEATTVHVNIMMKPEIFDHCFDVAKRVAKIKGVSIALQPLYEGMDGAIFSYSPEQNEILDKQMHSLLTPEELSTHYNNKEAKIYRGSMVFSNENDSEVMNSADILLKKLNNFHGWKCYAGLENLAIDMFGNVRRAWCDSPNIFIGNLSHNFSFPTEPIVCASNNCYCGFDIMCTKHV